MLVLWGFGAPGFDRSAAKRFQIPRTHCGGLIKVLELVGTLGFREFRGFGGFRVYGL